MRPIGGQAGARCGIIRMGDVLQLLAHELFRGVTEHIAEFLIDVDEVSVEINARDPDRRVFEHRAVDAFIHFLQGDADHYHTSKRYADFL